MSKRSLRKEYEYKDSYEFEDRDTVKGRRMCKKRGHRKVRVIGQSEIAEIVKEVQDNEQNI